MGEVLDMVRDGRGDFMVAVEDLEDEVERLRKQVAEKPVVYISASGGVTQYADSIRGDVEVLNIDWDETDTNETGDAHASLEYINDKIEEFTPFADIPVIAEQIRELNDAKETALDEIPEDEREAYTDD